MFGSIVAQLQHEAAGFDAHGSRDRVLVDTVRSLESLRAALDAVEAECLAELDARGVCDVTFGLGTVGWLAREGRLARGTAKGRVVVAKGLRRMPELAAALAAGEVSFDHARVLVDAVGNPRVGEQVAPLVPQLVAQAEGMVFERWAGHVRSLVALLDQDGGYDPAADPAVNTVSYASTIDGILFVHATLIGGDAEAFLTALNQRADELFAQHTRDHEVCADIEVPARPQLLALALSDLVRGGRAVDTNRTTPAKPEVSLVVDACDPDVVTNDHGVVLADGSTRTLVCAADWYPVIVDRLGVPLDLGRAVRHATRAQRRALARRDGGCVFPGCGAPIRWLDVHHQHHWNDGGGTDVANLVGLCRHHHGVAHRTGWHLEIDRDGWVRFQTPTGTTFWGQRHGRQRQGPAPPIIDGDIIGDTARPTGRHRGHAPPPDPPHDDEQRPAA